MKKVIAFVLILMIVAAGPAWCVSRTVDTFIENKKGSDMAPIADAGKVMDMANQGMKMTLDAADPVLGQRKHVTGPVMDGVKMVVNTTWNVITMNGKFSGKK
jgi:hypothetical protein